MLLPHAVSVSKPTDNGIVPTDYVGLFSGLFEFTSDAVCIQRLDDGVLLDVNKPFLHLFDLARAEAIGHRAADLGVWLQAEDREAFELALNDRGRVEGYSARMRGRRGGDFGVSVSAVLAEWRGQTVILGIGSILADG
jgi:PAS domain S-box-containing protein